MADESPMHWKPIDSAPQTGATILSWASGWVRPRFVRWLENPRSQHASWNDAEELDEEDLQPTHWLPLALPEEA